MRSQAPEKAVVKECLDWLHLNGIFAYRQNTGAAEYIGGNGRKRFVRFGEKGASDIIGILPGGRFLAVECKAENGRLSEYQIEYLANVRRMGGLAVVAKSSADIEAALGLSCVLEK